MQDSFRSSFKTLVYLYIIYYEAYYLAKNTKSSNKVFVYNKIRNNILIYLSYTPILANKPLHQPHRISLSTYPSPLTCIKSSRRVKSPSLSSREATQPCYVPEGKKHISTRGMRGSGIHSTGFRRRESPQNRHSLSLCIFACEGGRMDVGARACEGVCLPVERSD